MKSYKKNIQHYILNIELFFTLQKDYFSQNYNFNYNKTETP